ncbi:MAG: hypothetical protein ACI83O_000828 [Patescibacteria group bacterium]|jgi:hypothetical protein
MPYLNLIKSQKESVGYLYIFIVFFGNWFMGLEIITPDYWVNESLSREFPKVIDQFHERLGPAFGVDEQPDSEVVARDLFFAQGYYGLPNRVNVNVGDDSYYSDAQCCDSCWGRWVDRGILILTHELAHFYHELVNPGQTDLYMSEFRGEGGDVKGNIILAELIAEISSLRYFDLEGRFGDGYIATSLHSGEMESGEDNYPALGRKFYQDHAHQIDSSIDYLSKVNYDDVGVASVIDSYVPHLRTVGGMPYFLAYGMCGTVTDVVERQLTLF